MLLSCQAVIPRRQRGAQLQTVGFRGRENSMGLNPEMMDLVLVWLMSLPWVLLGYPQMTKRGKGHRASSSVVEKRTLFQNVCTHQSTSGVAPPLTSMKDRAPGSSLSLSRIISPSLPTHTSPCFFWPKWPKSQIAHVPTAPTQTQPLHRAKTNSHS